MGGQSRETTELQWRFPLFFCWQWLPRLPPRQTPRLRLTLTSCTEDTMAMDSATAMDTDTPTVTDTTARGRLRLSPRLRLTLTSCTVDTTAMDSATAMDTDTPTDMHSNSKEHDSWEHTLHESLHMTHKSFTFVATFSQMACTHTFISNTTLKYNSRHKYGLSM